MISVDVTSRRRQVNALHDNRTKRDNSSWNPPTSAFSTDENWKLSLLKDFNVIILTICKKAISIDEVEEKVKPDSALLCLHDEDLIYIDCHEWKFRYQIWLRS
jgi:hypothetical protein